MGLTIKMRIDEQPEHTYVFTTGENGEIELIPFSTVLNGDFYPPQGKAFSEIHVAVPSPELTTLNITSNGTYEAEDGTVWDVVNCNVEPLLETVTRTFTENGTYTISHNEQYDGIDEATVTVDVPEPSIQDDKSVYLDTNGTVFVSPDVGYEAMSQIAIEVDVAGGTPSLESLVETITQNGTYNYTPSTGYDGFGDASITVNVQGGGGSSDIVKGTIDVADTNAHEIAITVPTGKSVGGFAVVPRNKTNDTESGFNYIMNGGGRNQNVGFCAIKENSSNYWFKLIGYKASTTSTTSITAQEYRQIMASAASTSGSGNTVVYDISTDKLKYIGRANDASTANAYGLAVGCTYDYYVWFI